MAHPTGTLQPVAALQLSLLAAVRRWSAQLNATTSERLQPPAAHRMPLIRLEKATDALLDVQSLISATPLVKLQIEDKDFRKQISERVVRLMATAAATSGTLWDGLSEFAWETARGSLLIKSGDRFPVSAHSALGALAQANFLNLFQQLQSGSATTLELKTLQTVILPLEVVEHSSQPWQIGDLWVWLSLARTVVYAYRSAAARFSAANPPHDSQKLDLPGLCRQAAARFVRQSTLCKLIDAPRLPAELAQAADYQALPGLQLLTADPGASAARRLLTAELAFNLSQQSAGPARGAWFRWLQGLSRLPVDCQAAAKLNIAHCLWELLELSAEPPAGSAPSPQPASAGLLRQHWDDAVTGPVLRQAVAEIEQMAAARESDAAADLHQRLHEVRYCLVCYPEYRELVKLIQQLPAATEKPIAADLQIESVQA